ncbi:MAG: Gfo/Idh/MocA family protein [Thermomicrobiales bacterium]
MVAPNRARNTFRRTDTIRVGVIGAGFGAAVHIPALHFLPETEVVAVCARRPERAHLVAAQHRIPTAVADYREIIRNPAIDAVVIATPPYLHHSMAIAALEAGKHILCEKPMARNLAETRDMVKIAAQARVVAMVNHEFRFMPARARAKELIDEGYLGEPRSASLVVFRSNLSDPNDTPFGWLMEQDKAGGMLGAAGSHHIDALRWWYGEVKGVTGATATMVKRRRLADSTGTAPVDADDTFAFILRFVNGAIATVHFTATGARDGGEHITLSGSEGMLIMQDDGRLYGARRHEPYITDMPIPDRLLGGVPTFDHPLTAPTVRLLREWVRAIRTGVTGTPSFADGAKVQEILDGVSRSSHQGRWIDVSGARFGIGGIA